MKKNNKGFTLAELLIVVAIIAVLVAIAIPVFTSQLEKSREATDQANLRSLYAETVAAVLSEDTNATTTLKGATLTVAKGTDGVYTGTATYTCQQQKAGLESDGNPDIGGVTVNADAFGPGSKITIVVKSDGTAPTIGTASTGG